MLTRWEPNPPVIRGAAKKPRRPNEGEPMLAREDPVEAVMNPGEVAVRRVGVVEAGECVVGATIG